MSRPLQTNIQRSNPWMDALVWYAFKDGGVWEPGKVLKYEETKTANEWKFVIETASTTQIEIISPFSLDYQMVKKRDKDPLNAANITDMTSLSFLNEPEMLECMKQRFQRNLIYTNTGPILFAVNPFQRLPVYTDELLNAFEEADQTASRQLGPHVYQISSRAFNKMFIDKFDSAKRENQSVLVNGESGAGKTESTKQVLHYLAATSGKIAQRLGVSSRAGDFENTITSANPITESFGNAKTSRNNNSSRFGKFIELQYTSDGYIDGAVIRTYLLETVRVVTQMEKERNYHIFYEVFAGVEAKDKEDWQMLDLKQFKYTNRSGEYNRHDGEQDIDNFHRLTDAMRRVDLNLAKQRAIFKTIACILHIGNLSFQQSTIQGEQDAAVFSNACTSHIEMVCRLLGVDSDMLREAVTKRTITVAGNAIRRNLNVDAASAACDVLAKYVYDQLFKLMIDTINKSIEVEDEGNISSFIGILDIFGFEYFKNNSFEQLCINYANEKLQDHFNYAIFESEKEVYSEEGLEWNFTDYPNNAERLLLFEHKTHGIYSQCDEYLKIPQSSDKKLADSFYNKCVQYRVFSASQGEQRSGEFTVKHFACDVKYSTAGFLDKNRNEVATEITLCFESSAIAMELGIVRPPNMRRERSQQAPKATVGRKMTTLASQFSDQLKSLVEKIRKTRSHFIRCIKSNNNLVPNCFDYEMVMKQLRCGGALGAVQVFQAGFPNRMEFKHFVNRFSAFIAVCGSNPMTDDLIKFRNDAIKTESEKSWRLAAGSLVKLVPITTVILNIMDKVSLGSDIDVVGGLQMGKSQVFLRSPVFEYLEQLHGRTVAMIAKRLQRMRRAWRLVRKNQIDTRTFALLSVMHFSDFSRRKARKVIKATIVLQRRARVYLEYLKYLEQLHGRTAVMIARRLQRTWRQRVRQNYMDATSSPAKDLSNMVTGDVPQELQDAIVVVKKGKFECKEIEAATKKVRDVLAKNADNELLISALNKLDTIANANNKAKYFSRTLLTKAIIKLIKATIVIQRRARVYLAVKWFKRAVAAYPKINRVARGFLGRLVVKRIKRVKLLQRWWRGCKARMTVHQFRQKKIAEKAAAKAKEDAERANFQSIIIDKLRENPNLFDDVFKNKDKVLQLEQQLRASADTISRLQQQNRDYRAKIEQADQTVSKKSVEEIAALQQRVRELETALGDRNRNVSSLEAKLQQSEVQVSKVEAELLELRSHKLANEKQILHMEEVIVTSKSEISDLRITKMELQGKFDGLSEGFMQLKDNLETVGVQKAEAEAKMVALKHELVDLSSKLDVLSTEKDRAEQAVDDAQRQVMSLRRAIGEQGESTEEARQELAAAQEELSKKQSKLSEADVNLSKCNDEMRTLRSATESLESETKELKMQKSTLEFELESAVLEMSELRGQLVAVDERRQREVLELINVGTALQGELAQKNSILEESKVEIKTLLDEKSKLAVEKDCLHSNVKDLETNLKAVEEKNLQTESTLRGLDEELTTTKSQMDAYVASKAKADEDIKQASLLVEQLQSKILEAGGNTIEATKQLEAAKSELVKQQSDLEAVEAKIAGCNQTILNLTASEDALKLELQSTIKEKAEVILRFEESNDKIVQLEKKMVDFNDNVSLIASLKEEIRDFKIQIANLTTDLRHQEREYNLKSQGAEDLKKLSDTLNSSRVETIQKLQADYASLTKELKEAQDALKKYVIVKHGANRDISLAPFMASVTNWSRLDDGNVLFNVTYTHHSKSWEIMRSYRDFKTLRTDLDNNLRPEHKDKFPPETFMQKMVAISDIDAAGRKEALDDFLSSIFLSRDVLANLMEFFGADVVEK